MSTEFDDLDAEVSGDPLKTSQTIAVVDVGGFVFWPHYFTRWAQKYKPPDHFLLTLLFLWDATVGEVGKGKGARGRLALSQIPVRERDSTKWLAAFEACGFFTVVKAGPRDLKGSLYEYKLDADPCDWEALFEWAAWITEATSPRSWDKVSPTAFGALATCAVETRGHSTLPEDARPESRFLRKDSPEAELHSAIADMVATIRKFLRGAK